MKRTLLVTLIAVVVGGWASVGLAADQAAGGSGDKHAQAREKVKALFEQLNLTDDQKTKIKDIFQKAHTAAKAAANRAAKREIFKTAFEDAKKVLTAEQLAKLQELRKEHRQNHAAAQTK